MDLDEIGIYHSGTRLLMKFLDIWFEIWQYLMNGFRVIALGLLCDRAMCPVDEPQQGLGQLISLAFGGANIILWHCTRKKRNPFLVCVFQFMEQISMNTSDN